MNRRDQTPKTESATISGSLDAAPRALSVAAWVMALVLLVTALAPPAWSQESEADDEERVDPQQFDSEITVTARHREESAADVPISLTTLSGESIDEARIDTLQELEHSVPNLVFGETGTSGETFVGLRGIGDFSRNIGFDTRVGVYIDGVFAGQSLSVDQGLVDIAQVEVLRGPQGTLFGKNSSSGAINILTTRPELGQTSGRLTLGLGNLDTVSGQGLVNFSLSDTVALRLSAVSQSQDGYITNLLDGKELMTNDHTLGRGRLRIRPSDRTDVNLSIDVRQQDNDLLFLEPDPDFELAAGNPAAAPRFVIDQDAPLIDENGGWGAGLMVDHTLDSGHVLTSITGYRTVDRKVGSDEDATRVFSLAARFFVDDFEHLTQEVRLASPGDGDLRYVFGGFYFDQEAITDRRVALGPGFGGPPEGVDAAIQDSAVDTTNLAAFFNADWDVAPAWTISGGLRYTDESKDARIDQFVFPGFGLAEQVQETFDRDEDYVTSTLSVQHQATDNLRAYLSYSSGYKAGGFNVDLVPTVDDLLFEEETVDSLELGFKSQSGSGRSRLSAAAFHAEYDDYQVFQFRFDPFSGTTALLISNAASVTTQGLEVEGAARLNDSFEIAYGVGYTDATFDDFPGGAIDATTGDPLNVAGNTLPRAADWTGSITPRYNFSAGSTFGSISLNYTYRGDHYFNPDNRANSFQEAYGLLNAAIDLYLGERWSVGVWGRNLTDEEYRGMRGVSFLGVPFSLFAQPSTYGVDLTVRF